jgi:hypothetical protein
VTRAKRVTGRKTARPIVTLQFEIVNAGVGSEEGYSSVVNLQLSMPGR